MVDPYSILGLRQDADAAEIKAAWRTIAKAVHPDQNKHDPDASRRFAEAGQAYELLRDPEKRARYDRSRKSSGDKGQTIMQQRQAAREAAERARAAKANAERIMAELAKANAQKAAQREASEAKPASETSDDMIQRIFGAQDASSQARQPSQNTKGSAQSDPMPGAQAAAGGPTSSSYQWKAQPDPSGETAQPFRSASDKSRQDRPKSERMQADRPQGERMAGEPSGSADDVPVLVKAVLTPVNLIGTLFRKIVGEKPLPEQAPDMHLISLVTLDDVLKQHWMTVTTSDGRDLHYRLDPGVEDGAAVTLKGLGYKLPEMRNGDAIVTIRIDASPYRLDGTTLYTSLPVTLENAVLGCEAEIMTPDGPEKVTVAPWSGSDQSIRVAGRGLPLASGGRGDLVAEIRLLLWEKPDDKVTDLMRAMKNGLYL